MKVSDEKQTDRERRTEMKKGLSHSRAEEARAVARDTWRLLPAVARSVAGAQRRGRERERESERGRKKEIECVYACAWWRLSECMVVEIDLRPGGQPNIGGLCVCVCVCV